MLKLEADYTDKHEALRGLSATAELLFFHSKRDGNTPTGTPISGASNARGYEKSRFRPISRFILEMMQDRAIFFTVKGE